MVLLLFPFLLAGVPGARASGPDAASEAVDHDAVMRGMMATAEAMDDQVGKSRLVLQGLSSAKGSYAQYRNVETLRATLRTVKEAVVAVNTLLPAATETAAHFDAAYPETEIVRRWGRNTDIERYSFALRDRIEVWEKARLDWARQVNDDCRADLDQAAEMLANPAMQTSALGHMELWVIGYHQVMLEAVDVLYPDPSTVEGASVPLTDAERAEKQRAARLREEVRQVVAKVAAIKAAAEKARLARIASARFPKGRAPDAAITAALAKEFGTPLALAHHSDWMVRQENRWHAGQWLWGTYRYVLVYVAARSPSGKTMVYLTQLRSKKNGESWGPVEYWGVNDSFEMLPENL